MRETETGTHKRPRAMPWSCNICHDDTPPGIERCANCQSLIDYWERLTPEQRAEEIRMMEDQYVSDSEADQRAQRRAPMTGMRETETGTLTRGAEELEALYESDLDKEACHVKADHILIEAIRGLSPDAEALADAYERARTRIGFWYA